jgi:hypothetical protein
MLHLISHEKLDGGGLADGAFGPAKACDEQDMLSRPPRRLRRFLRRSLFGSLLLSLMGCIPLPPVPLPSLTPTLEAQAYRPRLRGGEMPGIPNRPPAEEAPRQPAQPAPSVSAPPAQPISAPSGAAATANSTPGQDLPTSLLDQAAQPAKIEFSAKSLSIQADNSSLGAILREIASKSGMQLQGFGQDERVFGSFGPGTPREVLDDLLNGAPYDLVMVGDLSNGAPRQLILSTATPGGPTPPSPQEIAAQQQEFAPPPAPVRMPETVRQMPPSANPQQVRSPQQMLQELQRMRAHGQQQGRQQ